MLGTKIVLHIGRRGDARALGGVTLQQTARLAGVCGGPLSYQDRGASGELLEVRVNIKLYNGRAGNFMSWLAPSSRDTGQVVLSS